MKTDRQIYGAMAESIVRRYCACLTCGHRNWKTAWPDQDGIDLQCRACGRFGQTKGHYCPGRISLSAITSLAGGSFAVHQRHVAQSYKIDLYIVVWNKTHEFVVLGIQSDDQPADLVKPRTILTGSRAGYALADIDLTAAPPETLRVLAARAIDPGNALPASRQTVWRRGLLGERASSNPGWAAIRERFGISGDGYVDFRRVRRAPRTLRSASRPAVIRGGSSTKMDADEADPQLLALRDLQIAEGARGPADGALRANAKLAFDGLRLPTVEELVCGCPPLRGSVQADANRFASDAFQEFAGDTSCRDILLALTPLHETPTLRNFQVAAEQYKVRSAAQGDHQDASAATRCHIYAALGGDQSALRQVAAFAVDRAYSIGISGAEVIMYVRAAVIWLLAATNKILPPAAYTPDPWGGWLPDTAARELASRMEERMLISRAAMRPAAEPDSTPTDHFGGMPTEDDNFGPIPKDEAVQRQ